MAELTNMEKIILEKLFDMRDGYVLDFYNNSFADFVYTSLGIDIYSEKYNFRSGSKANRLRSFWEQESNFLVAELTEKMLEYIELNLGSSASYFHLNITENKKELMDKSRVIIKRLKESAPIENIKIDNFEEDDNDFALLSKFINECIIKNQPEAGLDRLHTYTMKYLRKICESKEDIKIKRDKPIHSLLGEYIKFLKVNDFIDSEMTETILKTSISILDKFNSVRNFKSFAHDNPILNHEESVLIFNSISNLINFIETIEKKIKGSDIKDENINLPF